MRIPALAIIALLGVCAAAKPDVSGVWSFKTKTFDVSCVMTGELNVSAASVNGLRLCSLKAHEVCPHLAVDALESCTLDEQSGMVTITSKIVHGPAGFDGVYYPDNFTLKIQNSSHMSGRLDSAGGGGPVDFFRGPALTS